MPGIWYLCQDLGVVPDKLTLCVTIRLGAH